MTFAQDYVEVADRIADWYAKYPTGRITTELIEFSEKRVVVKAAVYRGIDRDYDLVVGVGHSFLAIPGSTPFTKGSELENAETSAVGRALVMAGIPAKNVASANEVRSKTSAVREARQEPGPSEGAADDGKGSVLYGEGRADLKPTDEDDIAELVVKAVKALGNKNIGVVVKWCHDHHPDWEIRKENDLLEWHLRVLLDEVLGVKA